MSGHKRTTVTISQEEYRRLYEAERRNYYQAFEVPEETLQPLVEHSQSNLIAGYQSIVERQDRYDQTLRSFQEQVQEVENATAQSLVDQQVDFYNHLLSTSEQLWQDTTYVFQRQAQEFEANVQSQHDRLLEQLNIVQGQVASYSLRTGKMQATAEGWLNDSIQLLNFISTQYPAELYDADYLSGLRQQISYASLNYESGFYEASLSLNQQVFAQLSSYRLTLEKKYAHYQALQQSIADRLLLIKEQCQANQAVQAIDMDGELIDQYIEVDYWNENQRSALLQEVDHALDELDAPGSWCNDDLLRRLIDEVVPSLAERVPEIVHEARRRALNAQLRYNTAQLVMVSLVQQGYRPEYGQFSEDDQRNGYLASATGPDGSEVTVKVDPTADVSSNLEIITHPGRMITEAEMKRRTLEIMQSLAPYGLQVGKIEEVNAPARKKNPVRPARPERAHSLNQMAGR